MRKDIHYNTITPELLVKMQAVYDKRYSTVIVAKRFGVSLRILITKLANKRPPGYTKKESLNG